jgi:hypothetical protein
MEDLPVMIFVEHADAGQFLAVVAGVVGDRPEVVVDTLPSGASKTQTFSTLTQSNARRSALRRSPALMCSFFWTRSAFRAVSHSSCDTILGSSN